jgi:AmmeMemoRadiSam system protein A
MPSRPEADRLALLQLARSAVVEAVVNRRELAAAPSGSVFGETRGVFVTLRIRGQLRGCIGILEATEPLGRLIPRCAADAAREDPRFSPVLQEELHALRIELSLLSPLVPSRLEDIVVGLHGILVAWDGRRGVLLPQVATEHRWDAGQFLAETCQKAGLPRDGWRVPGAKILAFTTEILTEEW